MSNYTLQKLHLKRKKDLAVKAHKCEARNVQRSHSGFNNMNYNISSNGTIDMNCYKG